MQNKRSKFLHPIYKLSPVTWLLKHTIPHLDRLFFKLSNGKRSFSQPLSGLPTFLIKHRGAKTGTTRTTPLICIPHGNDNEEIILIASNFGRNNNPAWYYNIK
ncbi:MAG: nitroreductase family deazaflavin-dependent oxidoreductase, partial [Candidatus Heimdallarchaeota archaeon]|nr:nitroreductase family deazaflavin-dependent oxidoreductase [Candidatus Heimdallarchaeota archaeon]